MRRGREEGVRRGREERREERDVVEVRRRKITFDCTKLEHFRANIESVSCSCSSLRMPMFIMCIGSSGC